MRLALIGYGRMGQMVAECAAQTEDIEIAGIVELDRLPSLSAVEAPDVAIDFSYPGDLADVLASATARGIPLVIGRTGLDEASEAAIAEAARQIAIVRAGNFSPGVTVMQRVAREMAAALGDGYDIEIVETHHRMKLDAPSGTAQMLVHAVDEGGKRPVVYGREGAQAKRGREIGVHALRGGTVCGEHTLHFLGDMEALSLTHRAEDRRIFAIGALRAARYVPGRPAGLYTMEDVLFGAAQETARR